MSSPVNPVLNKRLPLHAIASIEAIVEPTIVCCKYGACWMFQISIEASSLLRIKRMNYNRLSSESFGVPNGLRTLLSPTKAFPDYKPYYWWHAALNYKIVHCVFYTGLAFSPQPSSWRPSNVNQSIKTIFNNSPKNNRLKSLHLINCLELMSKRTCLQSFDLYGIDI